MIQHRGFPFDSDWEKYSRPLGNGYMGGNLFGRTDTERIQLSEKTLGVKGPYGIGGITNFAEIYLDIQHEEPEAYRREQRYGEIGDPRHRHISHPCALYPGTLILHHENH